MNRLADDDSSMRHVRIRAPETHRSVFHSPGVEEVESVWQYNLQSKESADGLRYCNLAELREIGRDELIESALSFCRHYIDTDLCPANPRRIILAGHQPTLFHSGVWYKNFVLSNLGSRFDCFAVNLIIDNDICSSSNLMVPGHVHGHSELVEVPFDDAGSIVPFEERSIMNHAVFKSFDSRLATAIQPFVNTPIINQLWPLVVSNSMDNNSGLAIARGRHAFESRSGLRTLEIPISRISKFRAFAEFFREVTMRLDQFIPAHNKILGQYRKVNKIRSRVHPVPELVIEDNWRESPFWIWQKNDPRRHSLFCQPTSEGLLLSDRGDLELIIPEGSFVDAFLEMQNRDIRIRPRALMTTLFSRLILSDLFVHGIGGAKYDQMTDELCKAFFGLQLPDYLTVTATMKIKLESDPPLKSQLASVENQLREMEFHPEKFIDRGNQVAAAIAKRKQQWRDKEPPPGQGSQKHQKIKQCNLQLQPFIEDKKLKVIRKRKQLKQKLADSRITGSREFSFCIFEPNLSAELATLAGPWLG